MSYAQINYNEIQGRNGKYRIAQIGCFITSFCNLLERFGKGISPLDLNREFINRGIYIDIDDGIRDDVGYWTISNFNPNIVVSKYAKGRPTSDNSIVKFTGVGSFGTHFCLVASAANGTIIDSWDGKVKSWFVYGGPVEYAEYTDYTPVPVTPVAPPVVPSVPNDSIVVQKGWGISHAAKAAGYEDFASPARWDYIARINGFANAASFSLHPNQVIKVRGNDPVAVPVTTSNDEFLTVQPGWGISHLAKAIGYGNYADEAVWAAIAALNGSSDWRSFNAGLRVGQVVKVRSTPVVAAPPATPPPIAPVVEAPKEVVAEPVVAIPVEPTETVTEPTIAINYKDSFKPLVQQYIATETTIVRDLDGLKKDLQLIEGQKVFGGGTVAKGDKLYVITVKGHESGNWYGLPLESLKIYNPDDLTDLDLADINMAIEAKHLFNNLTKREKLVATIANIHGSIAKFFKVFKRKKRGK